MEEKKFYTQLAVSLGTFFGGPLIGLYQMSRNYKYLGDEKKSKIYLISAIAVTLFLILIILNISLEMVPNYLFPVIFTGIISTMYKKQQKERIQEELKKETTKIQSGWLVFGQIILSAIIHLVIGFILMFLIF